MYALLAGFSNFGNIMAGYFGAYLLSWLGMDTIGQGKTDDFTNAWKACLISGVMPLLVLLLQPLLIPDASMEAELTENVDTGSDEDITVDKLLYSDGDEGYGACDGAPAPPSL